MIPMRIVKFYGFFCLVFPPFLFFQHRYQKNIMFVFSANSVSSQSLIFPKTLHPVNTSLSFASAAVMDPLTQGL